VAVIACTYALDHQNLRRELDGSGLADKVRFVELGATLAL
jgi:hypothetical protein